MFELCCGLRHVSTILTVAGAGNHADRIQGRKGTFSRKCSTILLSSDSGSDSSEGVDDDGVGGGNREVRRPNKKAKVAAAKDKEFVQKKCAPLQLPPSSSGWLSSRHGVPPVRNTLLKFAFKEGDTSRKGQNNPASDDSLSSTSSFSCVLPSRTEVGDCRASELGGLNRQLKSSSLSGVSTEESSSSQSQPVTSDDAVMVDSQQLESVSLPSSYNENETEPAPLLNTKVLEECDEDGSCFQQLEEDELEKLENVESSCESECEDYSDKQKKVVLSFLNESSLDELCNIPGCSLGKAKLLSNVKPFEGWDELVSDDKYLLFQLNVPSTPFLCFSLCVS